jgi:hypothetical protein
MSSERDSFAKGKFSTFAKGFLLHKLLLKVNYSPLRVKKSRSHDMGQWWSHCQIKYYINIISIIKNGAIKVCLTLQAVVVLLWKIENNRVFVASDVVIFLSNSKHFLWSLFETILLRIYWLYRSFQESFVVFSVQMTKCEMLLVFPNTYI